ncbi:MAG: hypothetical protein V1926_02915 [Candidatus Peregrinibacteria bacterium]
MTAVSPLPTRLLLITLRTMDAIPVFRNPACAKQAVESLYRIQCFNPFFLFAFVILPAEAHILLRCPEGSFTRRIVQAYYRSVHFELGWTVWEQNFAWREVEDEQDALHFIHVSPVRKGLCGFPREYPWSSASGRWDISVLPIRAFPEPPAPVRATTLSSARAPACPTQVAALP